MTRLRFAALLALAALFIVTSSRQLPSTVASHFAASGVADGFMPRGMYTGFMLALLVGLPALMVLLTWHSLGRTGSGINLPHKAYWLAPERREATIASLRASLLWFSAGLVVFLCYVHGLVVLAHAQQPPRLDDTWFFGGLVVFITGVFTWLMKLYARFRRAA